MSYSYNKGYDHGEKGGKVPLQGNAPADAYKETVAGVVHGQNSQKK